MHPIKCGFCHHGNPESSRFCNSCGAPLAVEPCSKCGAVNDVTASTCQKCEAPLPDSLRNELFLPFPPDVGGRGVSDLDSDPEPPYAERARGPNPIDDGGPGAVLAPAAGSGALRDETPLSVEPRPRTGSLNEIVAANGQKGEVALADSSPDELFLPLPPPSPANPRFDDQPTVEPPGLHPARARASNDDGAPSIAPSEDGGSETFQELAASRPRRRSLIPAAVVLALVVTSFFAYRHFHGFQPGDVASPPASGSGANVGSVPVDPAKPIAAPAASAPGIAVTTVVGADSQPAVVAPDRGAAPVNQAKASGAAAAGTKGGPGTDLFGGDPGRPQGPTESAKSPDPGQRSAARQVQEAPKPSAAGTAAEVRREAGNAAAGIAQRPAGAQQCTDALAALGLCKNDKLERREQ
jgi:ribosomal protein L40E